MRSVRAYASIVGAEATGRAVAFVVGAAIARQYGLTTLAALTLAQSLAAYVTVTSDGGLNNHALMRLFRGSMRARVVSDTSRAQLLIVFATVPIIAGLIWISTPPLLPLFLLLCLIPVATALSTPYLLQFRGALGPIATSRVLGALATCVTGAVLVLVVNVPEPFLAVPYCVGAFVMLLTVYFASNVRFRWYFAPVSLNRIGRNLSVVRTLGLSALLKQVMLSAPLLLAANFGTKDEFASMGVVNRLWILFALPASMLATVLIPVVAAHKGSGLPRAYRRFMAMLLVGSGCVVILVSIDPAWILSTLFGDEAGTYGADLSVFTIALLPLAVYSVVSCRIIVAGEYLILAMSYTSGILVLLVLYGAKVSFLDSISLSWAWVISQISVLVVMGVAFEFKQRGRTS